MIVCVFVSVYLCLFKDVDRFQIWHYYKIFYKFKIEIVKWHNKNCKNGLDLRLFDLLPQLVIHYTESRSNNEATIMIY